MTTDCLGYIACRGEINSIIIRKLISNTMHFWRAESGSSFVLHTKRRA